MAERRKPAGAQDKLAFLLALVPYLIDRDRVSVAEAARHFGVPEAQIRDAVTLIAVSGIPGETHQYQPDDLFDIAWDALEERDEIVLTHLVAIDDSPRFSAREAAALIAGLQYLSSLPENANREAISSLQAKLSRGSSASPTRVAVGATDVDETVTLISTAITSGRQLEFDYVGADGESERRSVDPLRVESLDADWYLRAFCHLRAAVRTFRIDRISHPIVTNEAITFTTDDVTLPDTLFDGSSATIVVTIDVTPSAAPLLAEYLPEAVGSASTGTLVQGMTRVTMRVPHYHGLKRLIAGMAGTARVVAPEDAKRAVADWAAAGAARYSAERLR